VKFNSNQIQDVANRARFIVADMIAGKKPFPKEMPRALVARFNEISAERRNEIADMSRDILPKQAVREAVLVVLGRKKSITVADPNSVIVTLVKYLMDTPLRFFDNNSRRVRGLTEQKRKSFAAKKNDVYSK
jgi:hypothetical protein